MSSQPGVPEGPPPEGGEDDSRLHIRAITELPAGHDAELATIFREMRRAADMTIEQTAARLATSLETIHALENGAVRALPEWTELSRIVTSYAGQLGLDSRPILRRLEAQIGAKKPAVSTSAPAATPPPAATMPAAPASAVPSGPPMPPSARSASPPAAAAAPPSPPRPLQSPLPQPPGATVQPRSQPRAQPQPQNTTQPAAGHPADQVQEKPKGRMSRLMRSLLNWAVLVGFVVALGAGLWYAAKHPRMVWSAVDSLPAPIPRIMRSAWNFMRPLDKEPARPPISDPDNRKSDRLP